VSAEGKPALDPELANAAGFAIEAVLALVEIVVALDLRPIVPADQETSRAAPTVRTTNQ
jgi:hypothetical protein